MNLVDAYIDFLKNRPLADRVEKALRISLHEYQKEILNNCSQFKAAIWGRRTGKSIVLCVEGLMHAIECPGSNVLILVPYNDYVRYLINCSRDLIEAAQIAVQSVSSSEIRFENSSRIMFRVPGNSIRGCSADLICADEITNENNIEEFIPIIARSNGKIFVAFTPGCNSAEFVNNLRQRGFSLHHCTAIQAGIFAQRQLEVLQEQIGEEMYRQEILADTG